MKGPTVFCWFAAALVAAAARQNSSALTPRNSCAVLKASSRSQGKAADFKPSEVYACLRDVPIDREAAASQIAWYKSFFQFQTTLGWLKSPTPEYQLPLIDVMSELSRVETSVKRGDCDNEYDFEANVTDVVQRAGDGHFSVSPYLVAGFGYDRGVSLASVSLDGVELPKLYITDEIQTFANKSSTKPPSAVKNINGKATQDFLTSIFSYTQMQDLDAAFNSIVANPGQPQAQADGIFAGTKTFSSHEDFTVLIFENGTSKSIPATAKAASEMKLDFNSGAELYKKVLDPGPAPVRSALASLAAKASATATASPSTASGGPSASSSSTAKDKKPLKPPSPVFPTPDVQSEDLMSGYLLDGENADAAVLSIASFEAEGEGPTRQFQKTTQDFLTKCKSAGKNRLVIDVRGNGGGTVFLGYDTFKQLFPTLIPFSRVRARLNPDADAIGKIIDSLANQDSVTAVGGGLIYVAKSLLQSPAGLAWSNWAQLSKRVAQKGDTFTQTASYEFNNATLDPMFSNNITMSGYADRADLPAQVFAAENITLLTDSNCGSTCAIFADLLIKYVKVKTVTIGGRPSTSPIAAIGAVRGANVLTETALRRIAGVSLLAQAATPNNLTSAQKALNLDALTGPNALLSIAPINQYPDPKGLSVNFLDNIAEGDEDMVPLQMKRGPEAECRIWYQPEDFVDVKRTWGRVLRGAGCVKTDGQGDGVGKEGGAIGQVGASKAYTGDGARLRAGGPLKVVISATAGALTSLALV